MIIVLSLPFIGELRDLHFVSSQDQRHWKWLSTGSVPQSPGSYGPCLALVCLCRGRCGVTLFVLLVPSLWQEGDPRWTPPEPSQGRSMGSGTAGNAAWTGNKIPILRTQELVLGARPRVPKHPEHTPRSPSTGSGHCKSSASDPREEQGLCPGVPGATLEPHPGAH